MFTGIVEEIGTIREIARRGASVRLSVACSKVLDGTKPGDSICVNGICFTVSGMGQGWFAADVMPETVRRTGLDALGGNDRVNLERALRPSDRLGGHIVSGHIDGTGTVTGRSREDDAVWLTITAPDEVLRYIVHKGSVALDGTSLTVARVDSRSFAVSLVPTTTGKTTLGERRTGDMVNIECDVIGKYVEKLLDRRHDGAKGGVTMEMLENNGFV
jgi:riboflavin synthase